MRTLANKVRLAPTTRGLGTRVVGPHPPWWAAAAGGGGAPAPTDPYFSDVVLLMHMDGAHQASTFVDSSSYGHTITAVGSVKTFQGPQLFGSANAIFNQGHLSFDELETEPEINMGVNSTPFTIEMWLWAVNSTFNYTNVIFGKGGSTAGWHTSTGLQYMLFNESGNLYWQFWESGSTPNTVSVPLSSLSWTTGAWHHLAISYDGTTTRLFFDGVVVASGTGGYTHRSQGHTFVFGAAPYGGYDMIMAVDDTRFTNGVARFTSDFTLPTAAYPDQ